MATSFDILADLFAPSDILRAAAFGNQRESPAESITGGGLVNDSIQTFATNAVTKMLRERGIIPDNTNQGTSNDSEITIKADDAILDAFNDDELQNSLDEFVGAVTGGGGGGAAPPPTTPTTPTPTPASGGGGGGVASGGIGGGFGSSRGNTGGNNNSSISSPGAGASTPTGGGGGVASGGVPGFAKGLPTGRMTIEGLLSGASDTPQNPSPFNIPGFSENFDRFISGLGR